MAEQQSHGRTGLYYGLAAYLIWGFLPLYFKLLRSVSPGEILAQRALWSLLFLSLVILVWRRHQQLRAALANRRVVLILAVTALLIAVNWLVYIWAVISGQLLEGSLGYFLNPLVNVALGVMFLKERLSAVQKLAVAMAAAGVSVLAVGAGSGLWISLTLALSFGFYGLLRKVAPVDALEGLGIETAILAPVALGWLIWLPESQIAFGDDPAVTVIMMASGVLTAIPLLLFAAAARRMPYATLGLLQYIAPTIQFLLAVLAFGEHLTLPHIICFLLIWAGLAVYSISIIAGRRRAAEAEPA